MRRAADENSPAVNCEADFQSVDSRAATDSQSVVRGNLLISYHRLDREANRVEAGVRQDFMAGSGTRQNSLIHPLIIPESMARVAQN